MKETQYQECSLEEATHVEVGGKVYKFGFGGVNREWRYSELYITVRTDNSRLYTIRVEMFNFLGIKPLKEVKREPIVFEAVFTKLGNGCWQTLDSLEDGFAYQNNKKTRFRCVEILEDEE